MSEPEAARPARRVRPARRAGFEPCDGSCLCCVENRKLCPCGSGYGVIDCLVGGTHPEEDER